MTTMAVPSSQAVLEWSKVFPKQATENYTSSVTFMKQLTVVAISTITYMKNVYPEDSYMVESFGGMNLKILKKKCTNEDAQFLSTALMQAFEAFDKKYLQQLALCFYADEVSADSLVEHHVFSYSYLGGAVSVRSQRRGAPAQQFERLRARTVTLLRSCIVAMQTCQAPLPPGYDVALRLYYNEDTPEEYQAPGYRCGGEDHLARWARAALRLGALDTPYHRLVAASHFRDTSAAASPAASNEAIASQNPPVITQAEDEEIDNCSDKDEPELQCPCNNSSAEPDEGLLTCYYCGARQHAVCYGVRAAPARHCCARCHDAARGAPTCARLAPLTHLQRESLCIFRRTLWQCSRRASVDARVLTAQLGVPARVAHKLLAALRSHGVLPRDRADADQPHKIIQEQLKRVIAKFFQGGDEPDIVDRLAAEGSQGAPSDPISEVLSPLEKVSLHNASNPCRLVDPPRATEAAAQDATLNLYKEAILSNDKVEELASVAETLQKCQPKAAKRKTEEDKEGNRRKSLRNSVKSKRAKVSA